MQGRLYVIGHGVAYCSHRDPVAQSVAVYRHPAFGGVHPLGGRCRMHADSLQRYQETEVGER